MSEQADDAALSAADWEVEQARLSAMMASLYNSTDGEGSSIPDAGTDEAEQQQDDEDDETSPADPAAQQETMLRRALQPVFLRRALQHAATFPEPVVLRGVLEGSDIDSILELVQKIYSPALRSDGWVARYGELSSLNRESHRAYYLHRGGMFQQECLSILHKLRAAVRQEAAAAGLCDAALSLHERCIEYHECERAERMRHTRVDCAHTVSSHGLPVLPCWQIRRAAA